MCLTVLVIPMECLSDLDKEKLRDSSIVPERDERILEYADHSGSSCLPLHQKFRLIAGTL